MLKNLGKQVSTSEAPFYAIQGQTAYLDYLGPAQQEPFTWDTEGRFSNEMVPLGIDQRRIN